MRYIGIVEKKYDNWTILEGHGHEKITGENDKITFEAVEIEAVIVLVPAPINRKRITQIENLTSQSIHDHRRTLEGLAR